MSPQLHNSTSPALDVQLIQVASQYARIKKYQAGDTICVEGSLGKTMFLILTGQVGILKQSSISKNPVEIGSRGAGEFLGEMALVEELPRSATIVAKSECEALEFSKESFEKIITEQPRLATRVLRSLSNKLRESDNLRIHELEESNRILNATNQELVRLNAFLDCVIDRSPSAVFLTTRDGQIYRMNAAASKMFSIDEHDSALTVDSLFNDFSVAQFRRGKRESWHGEVNAKRSGETFPVYLSVASLTGHNESMLNLLICQDITDLQAYNRTVRELEKYISAQETAAEMAHDLKNMLGVLFGNVDLILMRMSDDQKKQSERAIKAIRSVAIETRQYAENIMTQRAERSEFESIDLEMMINAILRFCEQQGVFRGVKLTFERDKNQRYIAPIREGQIQSVIMNLLTNAAEAVAERTEISYKAITVTLGLDSDDTIAVSVMDNGIGMDAETQKKLFKEHFTTKTDGHGIGLVSVGKIIEGHNGSIRVSSQPGAGATFSFKLPLNRELKDA